MLPRFFRTAAILMACTMFQAAFADEIAEKSRAVLEKYKASVVTVRIVIKVQMSMPSFGSRDEEIKSEATGTIIDPSGLTVLSLNETDPSGMFEDMMSGRDGFEVKSTIGDLKILQDDGSEIAAQVVLRDRDLDLAFIRPLEAPKDPLPALDLAKSATPSLADPIITITRLGRVASREHAVSIERVSAIVSRPRTFYVMGKDPTQTGLGSPALTLDGDAIGICVLRSIKRSGDSGMGMFGGGDENVISIVIPAADILDVAKQAPAQGEEPKELGEAPKEENADEPKSDSDTRAETPEEAPDGTVKPDAPQA